VAVSAVATGVIRLHHRHVPTAPTAVVLPSAPADPALLAALTRGGAPLPNRPVAQPRAERAAQTDGTADADPFAANAGPTPDDLDRMGAGEATEASPDESGPAPASAAGGY
jgi:hypothetical protein